MFADYITTNLSNEAHRIDYHIGWSVLYYLKDDNESKLAPYFLAGHCFDYTRLSLNVPGASTLKRWSSAVQAGLGSHIGLTSLLDLSITAQYMLHLGNNIEVMLGDGVNVLRKSSGSSTEGHFLLTFSLNQKIGKLW